MKQKRRIFGRLLTSIALLVGSLSCAFNGNAQIHYRGFVEGGFGAAIIQGASGPDNYYRHSNKGGGVGFGYMLATTHGIQLKNNFFGLGIGITPGFCAAGDFYYAPHYSTSTYETLSGSRLSNVTVPVYLNWRYDFFGSNWSYTPYFGIKAGGFISGDNYTIKYLYTSYGNSREDIAIQYSNFIPFMGFDLGLRKRLSDTSGISFGLSVQSSINAREYGDYSPSIENTLGITILAKIAFDF